MANLEDIALAFIFANPISAISMLERVATVQRSLFTLFSDQAPAPMVTPGVVPAVGNVASNIDEANVVPPNGYIGLTVSQFAEVNTSGVQFDILKDGVNIFTSIVPNNVDLDPIPDIWLPFRRVYTFRFTNLNTVNAAPASHAVADVVFIPSDIWGAIEELFKRVMAPLQAGYQGSRSQD